MRRHRSARRIVCGGALLLCAAVAAQEPIDSTRVPTLLQDFVPVTAETLLEPAPENWISFRNGYKLWGYSSLTQIDRGNVGELRLVWSRAMEAGWQEVEPLVYNGVMFLANVRDILQALDAATGDLLWEYRRALPDNPASFTGTLYRYRNVAIYDDKIFLATNDAFLVALDAQTGELVWETQRADFREQVAQTAGPIVVNGLVITGSRCNPQSPRPGGCFITGHDADTGEEVWRINTAATPDQPGGDTWGGLPLRGPAACIAMDGRQLRPGAQPPVLGHWPPGALAGEASWCGQSRPLAYQLDPGARPRDGRDDMVS